MEKSKEDIDVLNLNRRKWHHVFNEEEISDSSVEDLLEIGSKECSKCLNEIIEMLEKE